MEAWVITVVFPQQATQRVMRLWRTQVIWSIIHILYLHWWFKNRFLPWGRSRLFSYIFPHILQHPTLDRHWGHSDDGLYLHSYLRRSAGVLSCCGHMWLPFLHLSMLGPSPWIRRSSHLLTATCVGRQTLLTLALTCNASPCNAYSSFKMEF